MINRQLVFAIVTVLFLILATTAVILYGRGYRPLFDGGRLNIAGTGLLVATSKPDGASVFINGHLTTATDNTINLAPGEYTVKIFKDGYFPWEKKVKVSKEVVTKAEALLFPTAPKLESITNIGVKNPVLDPSQTRIAYAVASQSARRNGIYVLDLSTRPILTLQSSSTQITDDTIDLFSDSSFSWSPDGEELIATVSASQASYRLDATRYNQFPQNVTATLATLGLTFDEERLEKENARLNSLPLKLRNLVKENFNVLEWSLDDTKILYSASRSATLPVVISPRLIGYDTTPEQREIEKDLIYVYDIKEDKNFKILDLDRNKNKEFTLRWFPDSKHLIYIHDNKIDILEYDSTNLTTIYAGPFVNGYVFPWPDGSKIVVLTNLGNPNIFPNLYTIVLK
jgi:dipeptidyl aminopeptidase/acylaminoacyl peptidase